MWGVRGREVGSCSIYYVHSIAAPCKAVQVCACVNLFTVLSQLTEWEDWERLNYAMPARQRQSDERLSDSLEQLNSTKWESYESFLHEFRKNEEKARRQRFLIKFCIKLMAFSINLKIVPLVKISCFPFFKISNCIREKYIKETLSTSTSTYKQKYNKYSFLS